METRRKMRLLCCVIAASVGLLVGSAHGDRRAYVWTYEYMTMPKGTAELEYYLTLKGADRHNFSDKNTWEHQAELEYGITDHWDVAVYQRWQQTNTAGEDTFEYTGTKLRTRYRLGEKGTNLLDTLFYLEYKIPDGSGAPDGLEGKLVLAKDFGKFNIAYNQIVELNIDDESDVEHEYAFGFSYATDPKWIVGIESTGNFTEDKYYLGPTVSWASERFWVAVGGLAGLNDNSDDVQARLILGIPF